MARDLPIKSYQYKISDPNNRVKQMNGQNIRNPSYTGVMTTKVNHGAAVGCNHSRSTLKNVVLSRDGATDNETNPGDDVSPLLWQQMPATLDNEIVVSNVPAYSGYCSFLSDGMNLRVGDVIKFGGNIKADLPGAYQVLYHSGQTYCIFNARYSSGMTGGIEPISKATGTYDGQTNRYLQVGQKGSKMRHDRIHKMQHAVVGNEASLMRSGQYNSYSGQFKVAPTYRDTYPQFAVSGTSGDSEVQKKGLGIGGHYSYRNGIFSITDEHGGYTQ